MPSTFPLARWLARLSVGRKLMLIYLLDLSAVIFVSSALISEKYIAIDFARKELRGNAYLEATRDALVDVAAAGAGLAPGRGTFAAHAEAVRRAEGTHGEGMQSGIEAAAFATRLSAIDAAPPEAAPAAIAGALAAGRALVTRIGNQSNLILDPDLDSYYTMSLVVLRYPELLEAMHATGGLLRDAAVAANAGTDDTMRMERRMRYLVQEGRIDAVAAGIDADRAEAIAAGGAPLAARLDPPHAALAAAIEDFRFAAREAIAADPVAGANIASPAEMALFAEHALARELSSTWRDSSAALDTLLHARVDRLFERMAWELGTALALLAVILYVVAQVARSISRPIAHLADVAERVRRSGDETLRARGEGSDETARLIAAFNEMLERLGAERVRREELAASARAADAQSTLVEATPIPLVVTAIPGHEVLHANPPAAVWLGGRAVDPWRTGMPPALRSRFFQQLADRGEVDEFEVPWTSGRGEPMWALLSARRVRYHEQDAVLTAFTPISHLKLLERRLQLWARVFESSGEGILILDGEQRVLTANSAFTRQTGHAFDDLAGASPWPLFAAPPQGEAGELWAEVVQRGHWQGERQVRRRDGSGYPAWVIASAVREGSRRDGHEGAGAVTHCILTCLDISDRKASEERIRYLAEHDALTGLPNRALATERLRLAIQHARRSGRKVAVLFIDLDRFKDVNDSLGHHVGDALLRSVAKSVSEAVREGDTVCRLGGDEFVVVLGGVQQVEEVSHLVHERLVPRVRRAHVVEGAELHVACSVGIALWPDDAEDVDGLMRAADTAMYQAKAEGKDGARFYTAEMNDRAQARRRLEVALRGALEAHQLHLAWQPRIDAATGALVGVEGLMRWRHPELGDVSPAEFIPVAEETGLVLPMGAWAIEEACRQAAIWQRQQLAPAVSINLSARQLRDAGLAEHVRRILERFGAPAGGLELELTESMVMDDAEGNLRQMHALRALGIGLAIDDFGTGYSSLSYLSRFPIDKLKVDRSFVQRMLGDPAARAITLGVIGLGHSLGLKVVAEGVEKPAQARLLREAGCDELQGFLYARPMPAAELAAWLEAHRGLVPAAFRVA
jgi:diguanylate cyclase (GGDEF)-like protein/PAS domain S-box-containing protein